MSNQPVPDQTSWPTEIRLSKDRRTLSISFEDGSRFDLPAEYLRVESPSAEVQGHGPNEKKTIGGKMGVE
ncbi:MAG: gamma-butyrobetaine hydroxylase-like domain-containing protein, partial [Bosea sp. (in: a-proteobacteria)]